MTNVCRDSALATTRWTCIDSSGITNMGGYHLDYRTGCQRTRFVSVYEHEVSVSVKRGPLRALEVIERHGVDSARDDGMHHGHAWGEFERAGRIAVEAR
jgi:hypothetical protein